ncbi:MAG: glycosyltransferase [Syntrophomonas sp.]|nr:glycosyltransferase [Syntrophomonas sp.]
MKVLHLGEYARGGIATYINEVLAYQSNVEETTHLYLLLDSRSQGRQFDLNPENIFYYSFNREATKVLPAIIQIRKYLRQLRPDIVHVHSSFAGFLARAACFFNRKKPRIVYCAHGWSFNMEISPLKKRLFAIIERILARKTDLIINVSRYEYESACAFKLPSEKMRIIYNGVREAEFGAEPILSLDNDCINLLFVGRFDRQKGLDILLRFFTKQQCDHIKLYLLGETVLGKLSTSIPEGVVNLGWVNAQDVDAYYRLCDAVIIPSRWEGFGLVAIEAMRNKKAVIASKRGALPEIVCHGVNGYLFDLEEEQQLLDLLGQLNKAVLTDMGHKGYEIFKEKFTSIRFNEQILEQYHHLMS